MNIALLGATGQVGSQLLAELLSRGHDVTGIARYPEALLKHPSLLPRKTDVTDYAQLPAVLAGHDAVISAVPFRSFDGLALIAAVKHSGVKRFLVVGGAGSLEVAPGKALVDTPDFPAEYKVESLAGRDFLNALRGESALEWTFLSPSMHLDGGPRTGKFRLGKEELLIDTDDQSHISIADYAIALIDELENPAHVRQRFTVGY
jgi:putative NADH-flavin reductase